MKNELSITRTYYEPKFYLLNNSLLRTLLESIGLDLSFQRPTCWHERKMKQYCFSLINGRAPTPIIIVNIEESLKKAIEPLDRDYFQSWLNKGFKYISIDGNNRTVTLLKFFSGEVALPVGKIPLGDGTVTLNTSNNKWTTLPEDLRNEILENVGVNLYVFTVSTRQELSDLFTNINDGSSLKEQEKRNAKVCSFANEIRELATSSMCSLRFIFKDKKGNPINPRYAIDELLVKMATFNDQGITAETANKKALNESYEDGSSTSKNFIRSGKDNIRKTIKLVGKYGTSSFKKTSTLFNLFMTIYQIEQDGKKILNEEKFFEWFVNTESHRCPKVAYKNAKGDTWSYETCGNNSKKLDYTARLNLIRKDLKNISPDIVSSLDLNRVFTKNMKYSAFIKQYGKCNECDKVCKESEMYDSDLWHADHIIPHSKGGKTIEENCQLLCAPCNLKKSNK